jgi:ribosome maturation factor RimP
MRHTPLEHKIFELSQPVAGDMGLEIVAVKITGENGAQVVQIMAEDPKTRRLSVDLCAKLSRSLSAVMDVEDPINGAYRLEVSSPGIDRLLVREKDFEDYTGFDAKLEMDMPNENGQKRFRGVLKGIENGDITIATDQGEAVVPFNALKKAKLVLTEDLIKATAAQ